MTPAGTIGLYDGRTEFIGGSAQVGLFDFYGLDTGIPTSGQISLYDLRSKTAVVTSVHSVNQGKYYNSYYDATFKQTIVTDHRGFNGSENGLLGSVPAFGTMSPTTVDGIKIEGAVVTNWNQVGEYFTLYLDGTNISRQTIKRVLPQGGPWLNEADATYGSGGQTGQKVTYWRWSLGLTQWDGSGVLSLTIEY